MAGLRSCARTGPEPPSSARAARRCRSSTQSPSSGSTPTRLCPTKPHGAPRPSARTATESALTSRWLRCASAWSGPISQSYHPSSRSRKTRRPASTNVLILGIETSCDETSAAIVEDGRLVLSNVVSSQIALHAPYGGVVPEIASRQHVRAINKVVELSLKEEGVRTS